MCKHPCPVSGFSPVPDRLCFKPLTRPSCWSLAFLVYGTAAWISDLTPASSFGGTDVTVYVLMMKHVCTAHRSWVKPRVCGGRSVKRTQCIYRPICYLSFNGTLIFFHLNVLVKRLVIIKIRFCWANKKLTKRVSIFTKSLICMRKITGDFIFTSCLYSLGGLIKVFIKTAQKHIITP